jgi:hypothetical protein
MNLNFTATLSRQVVELLVRQHVEKAMPGHSVESVDFNVSVDWDFRGDAIGHRLKEVTVKLKPKVSPE